MKQFLRIDFSYPLLWGIDHKSLIKHIWLGWFLITWSEHRYKRYWIEEFRVWFQPGL